MSIHVTVNGNPIHLNRSRFLLTDVDLIRKNEWMRRRKIRLQQARQQAKDLANSVRGKVASQKKSSEKDEEEKKKCHEKKVQTEEIENLQQNFEECISAVGSAHRLANIQPECDALVREQEELRDAISRARGAIAEERLRAEKSIRKEKESVLAERRHLLKQVEELRAAVVRGHGNIASCDTAEDDEVKEKNESGKCVAGAASQTSRVSSKKVKLPTKTVRPPSLKQSSKTPVTVMPRRGRGSALSEGEDEQCSSDSDVTWPPRSSRVTKEPIPHPRVYDHNSRILKECPQKAYSVTHIPLSDQPDMCSAIAEEEEAFVHKETLSVAARRDKIVRGSKALRKERETKELQEVLKELKEADRQKKIDQAISGSYPSELHFRDARRKEMEKMRQARMNCYLPSNCVERREDQEPIPEIEHGIQLKAQYPHGRQLGQEIPHSSGQNQEKSAQVSTESSTSSSTTEETLQNLIKRYQKERMKLLGQLGEPCFQEKVVQAPQWVPCGRQEVQETESEEDESVQERFVQEEQSARIHQEGLPAGFSRSPPRRFIPESSQRSGERRSVTSSSPQPPTRSKGSPSLSPQRGRSPVVPSEVRSSPDVQITIRPVSSPQTSRSPSSSNQPIEQPPVVRLSMSPEPQPQSSERRNSSPGKVEATIVPGSANGQSVSSRNGEGSLKEKTEKCEGNFGLNENMRTDPENETEPSKVLNYQSRQTSPIPFSSSSASSKDSSQSGTVESSLTFEGLKVIVKICEKNSKSTKALPCKRIKEIQPKSNTSWDTRLGDQVTSSTSSGSTTYMSPPTTLSPNQQALLQSVLNKVQAKNKNPKLHDYIKKLLAMSRDSIEELGVSSSSDVSVHSSVVRQPPCPERASSPRREASCQAEDDTERKAYEDVMKYSEVANGYARRLQDIAKMIEDMRVFPRQWSRCLDESSGYLSPPSEVADPVRSGLCPCPPQPPDRPPMDVPSTLQPHPSHCRTSRPPISLLNGNSRKVAPEAVPHELSTIQEAESRSQIDRCKFTPTFDPEVSSIRGSPLPREEDAANTSSESNLSLIRDKEISSLVESSSDYEDVFRSLGIAWALPTVRKTRECQKRQESSGESSGRGGVTTSTPKKSPVSRSQRPDLSDSDSLTPPSVGLQLPPRPPPPGSDEPPPPSIPRKR